MNRSHLAVAALAGAAAVAVSLALQPAAKPAAQPAAKPSTTTTSAAQPSNLQRTLETFRSDLNTTKINTLNRVLKLTPPRQRSSGPSTSATRKSSSRSESARPRCSCSSFSTRTPAA